MTAKTKKPPPRAAQARTREDADAGVRDCVDLMTSGQWVSGKSHRTIAEKHGVSPATVKDWATSASRVIRLAIEGDRDDIRARMITTLEAVVAMALGRESATSEGDLYANPDLKAAVSAISEQAKILGLIVTKTQEVPMSEDEARAKYRELTGQDWPGPKGAK